MPNRAAKSPGNRSRLKRPTPSILIAGAALFLALGGSAVAAGGHLIHAGDIAAGAVTSSAIKNGGVSLRDLNARTQNSLRGDTGATGNTGNPGAAGAAGTNGAPGAAGTNGAPGAAGTNGAPGAAGSNGANGPNGANGVNGVDGTDGVDGVNGTDGIDGVDGTIQPLSTTAGTVVLPTTADPTEFTQVVDLVVPAGTYVVLAKTQLSHTGAGDSVTCTLKAGGSTIDQIAMKTLPALAAIPASLQAVTTTTGSSTHLTVACHVKTADGAAAFNSLIAIPTG